MSEPVDHEALILRMARRNLGMAGKVAKSFIDSKLTPLIIVAALALGAFAVAVTPREEEPQIKVPMIDVMVPFPGATAREVEERVATPLEALLWQIPGIDYVYTTSGPNFCMAIARFKVGQDPENSAVKLYTKILAHPEIIPPGASAPVIKPRSIDDVPILSFTLWSRSEDSFRLRQAAEEVALDIKKIPNISEVSVIGGERRVILVTLDPERLRAFGASALSIAQAVRQVNWDLPAGSFSSQDREIALQAGGFLRNAEDVRNIVVGVRGDRPLRLGDVAEVTDGPGERSTYVLFGSGPSGKEKGLEHLSGEMPAVTVAVAKKPGSNAVGLAHKVEARMEELKRTLLPADIQATVTRNYGDTAQEKSNELISHVLIATLAVVLLMFFALGRHEALVVAVAVPVTLALTLAASTLMGYTLNRVTLFALVFAIGILVDDAIVVVENIHRHFQLGWAPPRRAAVFATDEVGNPTILATFTVIAALLPLAFVSGLMGPYMRPIPINASVAMFFSLLVAFVVTPYVTLRVLGRGHGKEEGPEAAKGSRSEGGRPAGAKAPAQETPAERRIRKMYTAVMGPLLSRPRLRVGTLVGVVVLLGASMVLLFAKGVTVKMLPHDNKSEFQVIVDMPEGTTLERTAAVTMDLAAALRTVEEVTDYQLYVGTAGPMNFNGLVRHYFLRQGPNVADIQVNLAPKNDRRRQSHEIARSVRPLLQPIAERYGARIKVAEVPPGPPVLSTLVAEIYGPDADRQREVAGQIKKIFEETPGVVDVDWYVEDPQGKLVYSIDTEKAALSGITSEMISQEIRMAGAGAEVGLLHSEREREQVPIVLQTRRGSRPELEDLENVSLHAPDGRMVPVASLVRVTPSTEDLSMYHKNLHPVTYVTAEVAGGQESPIYAILKMKERVAGLSLPEGYKLEQLFSGSPESDDRLRVKWDGEWQITYEVFRDMGIAFAVVMLLVYLLVVAWFQSFVTPLIIMAPIPLTLIGILPGHWITGRFFTATSMIGFIALAGIIVRNSILLVDFINLELEGGSTLESAVLKAGAVRFRPIALTAAALVVGGLVIVLDPIFQGLAVSLIFGVVVSTALTLVVIPLLYAMVLRRRGQSGASGAEDPLSADGGDPEIGPDAAGREAGRSQA